MTDAIGEVTFGQNYDPYGVVTSSAGTSQTAYGFTGEQYSAETQMLYLRARYYNPADGRFQSRDTWSGDYNNPLSLNRWMYVEGNPVNLTDPSGHSPISSSQVISNALSQYSGSSGNNNILTYIVDCSAMSTYLERQYDLTGYLAVAMTKHGQDSRIKSIAQTISTADMLLSISPAMSAVLYASAYLRFSELENKGKEWDIKIKIQEELEDNIVLCGTGINCRWFDYSTPGNIHFGYVAGLAKIDHYIAAVLGGYAEQTDLQDQAEEEGHLFDWKDCFEINFPKLEACDNPQDQAAVDFGFSLARNPKYKNGITDPELRNELQANGMNNFQTNPHGYDEYWYQVYPQLNQYGADHFNK